MFNLQQKIMRHAKKNWKLTPTQETSHTQENKQLTETISEEAQMLDSADKDFKAAIINMF